MIEEDEDWIEHLRKTRKDFVACEQRHRRLERELNELLKRRILGPQEEMHKKILQKEKLAVKDRMNEIVRQSKFQEMTG